MDRPQDDARARLDLRDDPAAAEGNPESDAAWWRRGVIYQVYPRSFQDTDGDGVGDLPGITRRLPYLRWLGVDAIWLCPIYPSPMADFGYDVTDHTGVHPQFGTLADFDLLLNEAHGHGLRVILDWIPNHTSAEHPWFRESRASRRGARRPWYIWRDARPGGAPPNNWLSAFGGPAWTWDERTGQYYLHSYLPEQPDLNWRHPEVKAAMLDTLRFWLERGVDGFRVDALRQLIKDDGFRDNPPNPGYRPGMDPYARLLPVHSTDRPELQAVIAELRAVLDEWPDRLLIGELYLPIARLVAYYGKDGSGLHLPTNYHLLTRPWRARELAALIGEYEGALPPGAWPNWALGNHDRPRIATRVGPRQARVAAMLLLTLRGTPTMYYGDELGMTDAPIPRERERDPWGLNNPGLGLGRDGARTPMQWDGSPDAGFTAGEPWLPTAEGRPRVNVKTQSVDPRSMLSLYRRLLALRRAEPALHSGSYCPVEADGDVLAYVRAWEGRRFFIALNLGGQEQRLATPLGDEGRIVCSTGLDREGETLGAEVALAPDEGVVAWLQAR
jgi:alpha-glucosidase